MAASINKNVAEIEAVIKEKAATVQPDLNAHKTPDSWAREDAELARKAVYLEGELFTPRGNDATADVIQVPADYAPAIAVERGDLQALEKRRSVVEKALQEIDDKARWLETHPVGKYFDITGFRTIQPIGVTPIQEYISTFEPHYWISSWLPLVLSPEELLAEVDSGSLAAMARLCTNAIRRGFSNFSL